MKYSATQANDTTGRRRDRLSSCWTFRLCLDVVRKPPQAFKQSLSSCSAARHHIPHPLLQLCQPELLCNLGRRHRSWDILLVREYQEQRLLHFPIQYDAMKFLSCFVNARTVIRVNDEDKSLSSREVMPPKWSDLVLAADIPNVEFDVLVCYRFDVESDRRDCGDILIQLELVEDRGFPCGIEAQHEQAHFLGSEDLAHHFRNLTTHSCEAGANKSAESNGFEMIVSVLFSS